MVIPDWFAPSVALVSLVVAATSLMTAKRASARAIETQQSLHASDKRARLILEPTKNNLQNNSWAANQKRTLSLSLTNTGQRPATGITAQFVMDAIPGPTVPDDAPTPQETLALHPLSPDKSLNFEIHTAAPLSGDVINSILNLLGEPSYIIYAFVALTYDDGFQATRAPTFCWRWDNKLGWTPEAKHFHPD